MPTDEEKRLEEIMEVILAIAANDFERRASIGDGEHVLDGIAVGLNMLAEEVEHRRRVEDEYRARLLHAERLAAVGTLAAGVAHEINNPAAFLLGNFSVLSDRLAQLRSRLLKDGQDPEIRALVDDIDEIGRVGQTGIERIVSIVRGLRNFARIEASEVGSVRLDEVAEQACALVSREIVHRAKLVKTLAEVPPIAGETTKLTQVVTNLLLNAAQAIEEGAPGQNEVAISVNESKEGIVVRVHDTGRGIPNDVRVRIFEPFFTTKTGGQGTGLGLSISADIARQHGGELRLVSTPERGTTFELVIPHDTGLVAAAPPAPAPVLLLERRRSRVLFIDDEPQLLRTYRRMLATTVDVEVACGGHAALEILGRDQSWDAIVCDMLMPEIDGPDVWEWVEAHAAPLLARFLFCTGGTFTPRSAAFAKEHSGRVFEKPLGRAQLEAAISGVVAGGEGPG